MKWHVWNASVYAGLKGIFSGKNSKKFFDKKWLLPYCHKIEKSSASTKQKNDCYPSERKPIIFFLTCGKILSFPATAMRFTALIIASLLVTSFVKSS